MPTICDACGQEIREGERAALHGQRHASATLCIMRLSNTNTALQADVAINKTAYELERNRAALFRAALVEIQALGDNHGLRGPYMSVDIVNIVRKALLASF